MLAFIDDEKLDVDEVCFSPRKSNKNTVVIVMEDDRTKETHEVEMNLVPSSPNDSASGKIIALIPYSSPGFLSSSSDFSLVSSTYESPENKAPKSRRLLKKAKILKSKLFPRTPRTKRVIGSQAYKKKFNLPSPSQENVRKPLKSLDYWMGEMNKNDDESLGPDEEEFLDLADEELSQVPQSQILIEQGKMICKSVKNDLEILKVIDAAIFQKQMTPHKHDISPEQLIDSVKETESLQEIDKAAIQELIDVLEPIVSLSIEASLQFIAPSPSNESSILPSSVLVSTLNEIMKSSALLREQLNTSIDKMESEIQNSDDPIPEYEKALKIAKIRKEALKMEIFESMQTLKDGGTNEIMVALVENPLTKERQQVLVELVPTDPSNAPSPGRIVGFFENFESKKMPENSPRSMDYSFSEKLTPKRTKNVPTYVTSSREGDALSTAPRASKTSDFVLKPSNIDHNLIENDPNIFDEELELVDDSAEMSGFKQEAFLAKKLRNELVQILDIHSSTLIEEGTPDNVMNELEPQEFSQITPTQRFMDNSSFDSKNSVRTSSQPEQESLINFTTPKRSNPVNSTLKTPMTGNQINQFLDDVQVEMESLEDKTGILHEIVGQTNQSLVKPGQNPYNQFADLVEGVRTSQKLLDDNIIPKDSEFGSLIQTGNSPGAQFIELFPRVLAAHDLMSFDDSNGSVQHEHQQSNQQATLVPTQYVLYQNVNSNEEPKNPSPGECYLQLLPEVLAAEEFLRNESILQYSSPDQTSDSMQSQSVRSPTQYAQTLNQYALERDAIRSLDPLGQF